MRVWEWLGDTNVVLEYFFCALYDMAIREI